MSIGNENIRAPFLTETHSTELEQVNGIDEIDERIAECINPQKSAVSRKTRRHQHQENSHAPNIALISEVDTQVQEIKRVRDDFSNESNQVPRRHLKIRRG